MKFILLKYYKLTPFNIRILQNLILKIGQIVIWYYYKFKHEN